MIKVKNIKGKPRSMPDELPGYGSHSDEEYFYFFESKEEKKEFMGKIPIVDGDPPRHPLVELIESVPLSKEDKETIKKLIQ